MKNKIITVFLTFIVFYSNSQTTIKKKIIFRKHSIGFDLKNDYGYPNLSITYRKFIENSKFNFRGSIYLGGEEGIYPEILTSPMYNTNGLPVANVQDSLYSLIGINNNQPLSGSFQKIELGVERQFNLWKFKIIGGIDLTMGHSYRSGYRDIVPAVIYSTFVNGVNYIQFGEKQPDENYDGQPINSLTVSRNFVSFGGLTRLGLRFDLLKRFYATAFVGLRYEQELMVSERVQYKNDLYKHLLSYDPGHNTFNIYSFASIGIHFRF